jgi:ABC-type phosphate transport system substrate-binding protein
MKSLVWAALGAAWLLTADAYAGDDKIVVVLNARNPTQNLSTAEAKAKAIYTGQTAFWHGVVPMKVIARAKGSASANTFIEDVLGLSPQKYEELWAARQLAGQGIAPTAVGDVGEVLKLVAGSPGAIGFVLATEAWSQPPEGVKYVELR